MDWITPSTMDRGLLEAMFIDRNALLEEILSKIRVSATTRSMAYLLVIGPRGIGKTHLVSLVDHRIRSDPALGQALCVAWLQEDPYGIETYRDLLKAIIEQLARTYASGELKAALSKLDSMSVDDVEAYAERAILQFLGARTLLLIVENFDRILEALQTEGQQKLRAFLQTHTRTAILGTSSTLIDPQVSKQARPFFGTFTRYTLPPLEFAQAVAMMVKIARHRGDEALRQQLESPVGRARVRAIDLLAGGNPRIYIIFYEFLRQGSVDDLDQPFARMLRELTPYYQERMYSLPPLQRKIVDIIRRHGNPMSVKDIAVAAFKTSQTVSKELSRLKQLGYVVAQDLGRSSMYELREPLMRFALDTKEVRGDITPLYITFLRVWFSQLELKALLAERAATGSNTARLIERALALGHDPFAARLRQEFRRCTLQGQYEPALEVARAEIVREPNDPWPRFDYAQCLRALNRNDELVEHWKAAVEAIPDDLSISLALWNALYEKQQYSEALELIERLSQRHPQDLRVVYYRVLTLWNQDHRAEAVETANLALRAVDVHEPNPALWDVIAGLQSMIEAHPAVIEAAVRRLEEAPRDEVAWDMLFGSLDALGLYDLALEVATAAVSVVATPKTWIALIVSLSRLGRLDDAQKASAGAAAAFPTDGEIAVDRAVCFLRLGQLVQAEEWVARGCDLGPGPWRGDVRVVEADVAMAKGEGATGRSLLIKWLDEKRAAEQGISDFTSIMSLVLRTHSPEAWRPYVTTWVEVFAAAGRLTELGTIVLELLPRFAIPWFGAQVARQWVELWSEIAEDRQELKIALELLRAAIGIIENGDRAPLALLAVEKRRVLEPLLDQYERASGTRHEAFEPAVRQLLEKVVPSERIRQARLRFENASPVDVGSAEVERVLGSYDPRATIARPPPRLMPGGWSPIPKAAARRLLTTAFDSDARVGNLAHDPGFSVRRVDERRLSFTSLRLYEVHAIIDGTDFSLDLLAPRESSAPVSAVILDGNSAPIHDLEPQGLLSISPENEADYVRFFASALRADEGRFETLEPADPETVRRLAGATVPDGISAFSLEAPGKDGAHPTFSATILYEDHLSRATLQRTDGTTVSMLDDVPIAGPIGAARELYFGPFRSWAAIPEQAKR